MATPSSSFMPPQPSSRRLTMTGPALTGPGARQLPSAALPPSSDTTTSTTATTTVRRPFLVRSPTTPPSIFTSSQSHATALVHSAVVEMAAASSSSTTTSTTATTSTTTTTPTSMAARTRTSRFRLPPTLPSSSSSSKTNHGALSSSTVQGTNPRLVALPAAITPRHGPVVLPARTVTANHVHVVTSVIEERESTGSTCTPVSEPIQTVSVQFTTSNPIDVDHAKETTVMTNTTTATTNAPSSLLPDGWEEIWDATAHRVYFFHVASGMTQWEHPSIPEPPETSSSHPIMMVMGADKSSSNSPDETVATTTTTCQHVEQEMNEPNQAVLTAGNGASFDQSTVKVEEMESSTRSMNVNESDATILVTTADDDTLMAPSVLVEVDKKTNDDDDRDDHDDNSKTLLPEGWQALIDPHTGQTYYFHVKNNITQWERPENAVTDTDSYPVSAIESNANEQQQQQQQQQQHDEDGMDHTAPVLLGDDDKTMDTTSVTTTTHDPHHHQQQQNQQQSQSLQAETATPEWTDQDNSQNNDERVTVDMTTTTMMMTTHVPESDKSSIQNMDDGSMMEHDDDHEELLPPGWQALIDPHSGLSYYYHAMHNITQWERPDSNDQNVQPQDMVSHEIDRDNPPFKQVKKEVDTSQEDETMREEQTHVVGDAMLAVIATSTNTRQSPSLEGEMLESSLSALRPENHEPLMPDAVVTAHLIEPYLAEQPLGLYGNTYNSASADTAELSPTANAQGQDTDQHHDPSMMEQDINVAQELPLLPHGWVEAVEPTSGLMYYYHSETQVTQWERPVDDVVVDDRNATHVQPDDPYNNADPEIHSEDVSAPVQHDTVPMEERMMEPSAIKADESHPLLRDSSVTAGEAVAVQDDYDTTAAIMSNDQDEEGDYMDRGADEQEEVDDEDHNENFDHDQAGEEVDDEPDIEALPHGWAEAFDPGTGLLYYYHAASGTSSWDRPTNASLGVDEDNENDDQDQGQPVTAEIAEEESPGEGDECSTGWEVVDQTGMPSSLGEAIVGAASCANGLEDNNSAVELVVDEVVQGDDAQEGQDSVRGPASTGHDLPPGWEQTMDPGTGHVFYFNATLGLSSWEHPGVACEQDPVAAEVGVADDSHHRLEHDQVEMDENGYIANGYGEGHESETEISGDHDETGQFGAPDNEYERTYEASTPEEEVHARGEETDGYSPEDTMLDPVGEISQIEDHDEDNRLRVDIQETASDNQATYHPEIEVEGLEVTPGDDPIASAVESSVSDLPDGWVELIHDDTGQPYYYCELDGTTTWERPVAISTSSDPGNKDDGVVVPQQRVYDAINVTSPHDPQSLADDMITDSPLAPQEEVDEISDIASRNLSSVALPDAWIELLDETSGVRYYMNQKDGRTSWVRPDAADADSSPLDRVAEDEQTDEADAAASEEGANAVNAPPIEALVYESQPESEHASADTSIETELQDQSEDRGPDLPECESEFAGADKPDLPPGWIELIDQTSGNVYYFNEDTGAAVWERPQFENPEGMDDLPTSANNHPDLAIESDASGENDNSGYNGDGGSSLQGGEHQGMEYDSGAPYEGLQREVSNGWVELREHENVAQEGGDQGEIPTSLIEDEAQQDRTFEEPATDWGDPVVCVPPDSPVAALESEGLNSSEWKELVDEEGNTYYYNEVSGATSWEAPAQEIAADDELALEETERCGEESIGYEEQEENIPKSHDDDIAGMDQEPQADFAEEHHLSHEPLPHGWAQLVDPASGNPYFLNEISGETSWDRPNATRYPSNHPSDGEQQLIEEKTDATHAAILPPGWEELLDPGSGQVYYFNAAENVTTWDRPKIAATSVNSVYVAEESRSEDIAAVSVPAFGEESHRPARAVATFGFGGRLCVIKPSSSYKLAIHKTLSIARKDDVVKIQLDRQRQGIWGPLKMAETKAVIDYVNFRAASEDDLIWSLVGIASKAQGRLRSDHGLSDPTSPETAIAALLLEGNPDAAHIDVREESSEEEESRDKATHLEVEDRLVRGKLDEAVRMALSGKHYGLALILASRCSKEVYQYATKHYADHVLLPGSPLYTAASVFSGQLPPTGLDQIATSPFWGKPSDDLTGTWKRHVATMISNRPPGWDLVVCSLGDRLLAMGHTIAAHFCYMVCACRISGPLQGDSRLTLLGCHVGPPDLALATADALRAFDRTEAYEWAKRRGNTNALIQSLQPFKLLWTIILADYGFVDAAILHVRNIEQQLALDLTDTTSMEQRRAPLALDMLSQGKKGTVTAFLCLKERLITRDMKREEWSLSEGRAGIDALTDRNSIASESREQQVAPTSSTKILSRSEGIRTLEAQALKPSVGHLPNGQQRISSRIRPLENEAGPRPAAAESSLEHTPPVESARSHSAQRLEPIKDGGSASLDSSRLPVQSSTPSLPTGPPPVASLPVVEKEIGVPTTSKTVIKPRPVGGGPPVGSGAMRSGEPAIAPATKAQTTPPPLEPVKPLPVANVATTTTQASGPPKMPEPLQSMPARPPSVPIKPAPAPKTAPADMQPSASKKRGFFDFGIKDRMTKWLNPDATTADLGEGMQAYYDEKRKVWVFPGEDPDEKAKPIGPPPKTPIMTSEAAASAAAEAASPALPQDPLAAMMAPPPRGVPSALRGSRTAPMMSTPNRLTPLAMFPPGSAPPSMGTAITAAAATTTTPIAGVTMMTPPPQFMVFQPTPQQIERQAGGGEDES